MPLAARFTAAGGPGKQGFSGAPRVTALLLPGSLGESAY